MTLIKTQAGQQVLKDRSVPLPPRQRTALIMLDGKRSDEEVLAATGGTAQDLDHLLALGLVARAVTARAERHAPADDARTVPAALAREDAAPAQGDRYMEAYQLATRLTSSLGLKGFRLNLAVEAASSFEDLVALAPRIRDAVGAEKFQPLETVFQRR